MECHFSLSTKKNGFGLTRCVSSQECCPRLIWYAGRCVSLCHTRPVTHTHLVWGAISHTIMFIQCREPSHTPSCSSFMDSHLTHHHVHCLWTAISHTIMFIRCRLPLHTPSCSSNVGSHLTHHHVHRLWTAITHTIMFIVYGQPLHTPSCSSNVGSHLTHHHVHPV